MTVSLIHGDCLSRMSDIPDSSIDLILTDPPYGVLNRKNESAQWDREIDLDALWKEYLRIIKKTTPIILFGQGMFTAKLMQSQPKLWKYNLIWEKDRPTGFLNANRMPLRSHEDILVFYDRLPTYNPQMIPCKPSERNHPNGNGPHADTNRQYGKYTRTQSPITDYKFPRSIIKIAREHDCGKTHHPTQKPVALCEWLIRTYTNEGDTVLDSCMGTGTTGVACVNLNRNFIGIEADPSYFEMAKDRITEAEQSERINIKYPIRVIGKE